MAGVDMTWPERRSERLHIRVEPHTKQQIEEASKEVGMSVSEFVVDAVRERADEVLARRTVVPPDYFDELVAALDDPPMVLPGLLDAMQKHAKAEA